ncbi:helix-turn-helix domain-containing protein [Nereida sp. MMG025]|uniref:helix-turn-helix domain-containing protein n=1 Tax=Nereida sp. MMG025 TaxID=2909981 RepID=UPI001F404F45|nr:helix-turn-helix domain-containing protein [Nereida sp. MMG025]MCF6443655.1 DUF4115 domain-containing protein [Nereida sp. MMG025]
MFSQNNETNEGETPRGFDAFDMRLGDVMRGERATLGKSLLDVQRELKIKASYISAIENADPSAFDSPGFIAGYVRSYARYLHLDPEWAFQAFCQESGFATAHGMSVDASSPRPSRPVVATGLATRNVFEEPSTPFVPKPDSVFSQIEAGAIGSIAVMIALVAGLGYGAYSIVQEVQQVEFTPVDQTPVVAASVDPLATSPVAPSLNGPEMASVAPVAPNTEALDRLYRPAALDVPVLTPRDEPIAAIDPRSVGAFVETPTEESSLLAAASTPQVVDGPTPDVVLFAVSPTWVRVRGADGSILFEKVLDKGEEYALPVTEETPVLRAGNSGSLYFKVNGTIVGPAGQGTSTVKDVQLASNDLSASYKQVDPIEDKALFALLKELNAPDVLPASANAAEALAEPETPEQITLGAGEVALFAVRPAWVRVRDGDGKVIFEKILEKGEEYRVPAEIAGTNLRAGNSGSLYFRVGDQVIGPVGPGTSTARNVSLAVEDLSAKYQPADTAADPALRDVLQQ